MVIPGEILAPVLSLSVDPWVKIIAAVSAGVWIYLLFGRGGYWRIASSPLPHSRESSGKSVVVVIPARNEEAVIGKAICSLLHQSYSGRLHLIVVDDHSSDGTRAVVAQSASERLTLIHARPLTPGWTGKMWALSEGLQHAQRLQPDYFLLTDADIVHSPDNVAMLVARAEACDLDLTSLMVKLHCSSFAERLLIPAFVYFFFQLYPPRWIASSRHRTAAAAGGCMLVRPEALQKMGGIPAIKGELIDDCALAGRIKKAGGRIWLGTTATTHSIREYGTFAEIYRVISRTAFTQLRHSGPLVLATVLGMGIVYLAPALVILTRNPFPWVLMTVTYVPMVRFYRQPFWHAALLPLIAVFYMAATVDSAVQHWRGRGGAWKGRVQDSSL